MITVELTDEQVKLVYRALKEFTDIIWDEPEMIGIDVDGFESDQASDAAILKYINTHINTIIDQMNKQIKP
jgi:hypothetical protein